jgi:uncharacterized damage-inducible protein DinB
MPGRIASKSDPADLDFLLQLLDESYDRKSWHGPNLRGSLRGVTADEAAWRPAPGRHNIWEIALHAAYWKYTVLRRISGEKRGSFPVAGSNWFPRPDPESPHDPARDWKTDLALLGNMHRRLRAAAAGKLRNVPAGSKFSYAALLRGAALHDVYHAGQIQLLKRQYASFVGN